MFRFLTLATLVVSTISLSDALSCYQCSGTSGIATIPDEVYPPEFPEQLKPIPQCVSGNGIPDANVNVCTAEATSHFLKNTLVTIEPRLASQQNFTVITNQIQKKALHQIKQTVFTCASIKSTIKLTKPTPVDGAATYRSCLLAMAGLPENACDNYTLRQLVDDIKSEFPELTPGIDELLKLISQADLDEILNSSLTACTCNTDKCIDDGKTGGGGTGSTIGPSVMSITSVMSAIFASSLRY